MQVVLRGKDGDMLILCCTPIPPLRTPLYTPLHPCAAVKLVDVLR